MRFVPWSAACALLIFLIPPRVSAQETVLVLGIATQDADAVVHGPAAARLTEALRDAIDAVPDWRVHGESPALRETATAHGCTWYDPDENCIATMGRVYGVRYVLYGRISLTGGPESHRYAVFLDVIDSRDGSRHGDTMRTVVIDGDDAVLALRARELLEDMNIRPAAATSAHAAPDRNLFWGLGIGSYTIAGLWLVATIASSVRIGDIQNDIAFETYRGRVPPGTMNVCDEAAAGNGWTYDEGVVQSLCSEAATLEVLQFVFLGAAAAFAGLGTAFLLFEPGTEQQPAVTLTPSVGRDRASLSLSGRF